MNETNYISSTIGALASYSKESFPEKGYLVKTSGGITYESIGNVNEKGHEKLKLKEINEIATKIFNSIDTISKNDLEQVINAMKRLTDKAGFAKNEGTLMFWLKGGTSQLEAARNLISKFEAKNATQQPTAKPDVQSSPTSKTGQSAESQKAETKKVAAEIKLRPHEYTTKKEALAFLKDSNTPNDTYVLWKDGSDYKYRRKLGGETTAGVYTPRLTKEKTIAADKIDKKLANLATRLAVRQEFKATLEEAKEVFLTIYNSYCTEYGRDDLRLDLDKASFQQCNQAYKKAAVFIHPDKNPTKKEKAEKDFKEISDNWELTQKILAKAAKKLGISKSTGSTILKELDKVFPTKEREDMAELSDSQSEGSDSELSKSSSNVDEID
jgi:hypothetical protein